MKPTDELSDRAASSIQEAIDSIVQAFDYPEELSMEYTSTDGRKVTQIEINREDNSEKFEVQFRGNEPDEEPVLRRITDE